MATGLAPGLDEEFYVDIYRREMMVYVRTAHNVGLTADATGRYDGRYVEVRDDGRLYNDVTDLKADTLDALDRKRRSAFWLIDWNGGDLRSGIRSRSRSFATSGGTTGRPAASASGSCGRGTRWPPTSGSTIIKKGGAPGTIITHDDRIALRTSTGRYVTAWPAAGGYQLVNVGRDSEGAWQQFTLSMVEHHDRARPSW